MRGRKKSRGEIIQARERGTGFTWRGMGGKSVEACKQRNDMI